MEQVGRCHMCKQELPIRFCRACRHWFCARCQWKWFDRGLEALKSVIGNPGPGCCGVTNG